MPRKISLKNQLERQLISAAGSPPAQYGLNRMTKGPESRGNKAQITSQYRLYCNSISALLQAGEICWPLSDEQRGILTISPIPCFIRPHPHTGNVTQRD